MGHGAAGQAAPTALSDETTLWLRELTEQVAGGGNLEDVCWEVVSGGKFGRCFWFEEFGKFFFFPIAVDLILMAFLVFIVDFPRMTSIIFRFCGHFPLRTQSGPVFQPKRLSY